METQLIILLNQVFYNEMKHLFGNNYVVNVKSLKYSTNSERYVLDCTLYTDDVELCNGTYPDGLILMVDQAWKFMFIEKPIVINSSLDLFP